MSFFKNHQIFSTNLLFCQSQYALLFQKSKPKWAYGFLVTAAQTKLRVIEKKILTKFLNTCNSYQLCFKHI